MKFKKCLAGLEKRIYSGRYYQQMFIRRHTQQDCFRQLYPGEDPMKHMKKYHYRKIRGLLLGCSICVLLLIGGGVWHIVWQEQTILRWQPRPDYLEGPLKESWIVRRADGTEQEVTATIENRKYTKEEAMKLLEAGKDAIDRCILGNNKDAGHVDDSLRLPESIEGSGISIQWLSGRPDVIDSFGIIKDDFQVEEGIVVRMKGVLRCQDYEDMYVRDFHVYPRKTEGDGFWNAVKDELERREFAAREAEGFEFPDKINGEAVTFFRKKDNRLGIICVLGMLVVFLQSLAKDEKLAQQAKKRKEQLLTDYPELISKLIVLMRAGMTSQSAFDLISTDYVKRRERTGEKRYAYEELLIACREVHNGVSPEKAYERYGKRCGILSYMRLGGLLTQNMKKGSRHLFESLDQEIEEAFEERKRHAKKAGEEAGTKMLMPMMLLLVTTIIIILYPAFASFQI